MPKLNNKVVSPVWGVAVKFPSLGSKEFEREESKGKDGTRRKRHIQILEKAKFIPVLLGKGALCTLILKLVHFPYGGGKD